MGAINVGLAVLVVAVWGSNFVVIKHALGDFQPFCFATLRFFFCAFPFAFFIRRPQVAWKWLALYGTLLGAGQFGLLYYAMRSYLSPGVASLVIQTQVFFTILISVMVFSERVAWPAIAGLVLAAGGARRDRTASRCERHRQRRCDHRAGGVLLGFARTSWSRRPPSSRERR